MAGGAVGLLLASGCMKLGHRMLYQDRFDYSEAISQTSKKQTLLNIVKVRYSDWPVFLDVEQVASQYSFEATGAAKALIRTPFSGDNDQAELALTGKYSERPTVLYRPLRGTKFMKSILSPIPPDALFALIHTGWPADRMIETFVHSINGVGNVHIEYGRINRATEGFGRFVRLLSVLQKENALVVDITVDEEKPVAGAKGPRVDRITKTTLGFRPDLMNEEEKIELANVKDLLGLNPGTNTYEVVWNNLSTSPDKIAFKTRSLIQVMASLAAYVEVAPEDEKEGRVVPLIAKPRGDLSGLVPLMRIRSGKKPPNDPFIIVRYRDRWFWIDDTDVNSKRTMIYLSLLLSIGETEGGSGASVVITTG
jgi:hypothetical protein